MAIHPATHRFTAAVQSAGYACNVREYPTGTRTASDAARALQTTVEHIVKSLIFVSGIDCVLVRVSGDRNVDEARVAQALSASIRRATPEEVRERTGSSIGGVAPVGHSTPIPTILDVAVLRSADAWVAAGTPTTVCLVPTAFLVGAATLGCLDVAMRPQA
jgi:prolyl-tRNA editing enzyme YbaK/EbsC (Cys-tRNA(Pro) deacylase)